MGTDCSDLCGCWLASLIFPVADVHCSDQYLYVMWHALEQYKNSSVPTWIFIGRIDAEAPVLWPPDAKSWLFEKDSDAEKGMTEYEMVGWHHRLNGHEFEQTPGFSDGQGGLMCCSPCGHRVGQNWATEQHMCHIYSHITDLLDQPHSVIWLICGIKWSSFKRN